MSQNEKTPETQDFAEILEELGYGKVRAELTTLMAEVVQAVQKTGKMGEVSLKIKVKRDNDEQVSLEPTCTHKAPRPSMGTNIFFAGDKGRLSREDPNQEKLPYEQIEDALPDNVKPING